MFPALSPLSTIVLLSLVVAALSIDCNQAPSEALRIVCQQLQRWDENSRKTPSAISVKPPAIAGQPQMAADFAPIASNMYQCMDIQCLCVFFRGSVGAACTVQDRNLGKALRKEYRQLSDEERGRVHSAFQAIKSSGEFDRLASIHAQFASSGGAHSGPAFLPWHREFIKRVEIALRQVDPEVALPYWDSTLDENMPDSKDSIIWTNEFMGETVGGYVVGGPFREWRTLEGHPRIQRAVGEKGKLFSEDEIRFILSQNDISQVLASTAPRPGCPYPPNFNVLEYTHGNPHIYVGGDMFEQATSGNDPIFYMHHSFVDYIWEIYRQNVQSRSEREIAYPEDNELCSSEHHFRNAFMRPFPPMRNIDGLSNKYTDNMYSYSPRPSCLMGNDCGSKYLYCDRSHGPERCASKIKPGGNCTGLNNGEDACYNGRCIDGRCIGESIQATPPPPTVAPRPVVVQVDAMPTSRKLHLLFVFQQTCFNEHECCSYWAGIGECPKNPIYMLQWCKASCHTCQPNYDLNNECLDRHTSCALWSRSGECTKNPLWMSENCRRACGKCGMARSVICSGGRQVQESIISASKCNSPMCFNEFQCCPFWAYQGECRTNPVFMLCQCRVSCQQCQPPYRYGDCADYHQDCAKWSRTGECKKPWMIENCRRSCNTCTTFDVLRQRCAHRVTRTAFFTVIGM
ncbi:unnamed protein product [Haemonchus placei]|uniref:ShKT domain-containing protein n=1 Tax=Haemonchus placei TaxID=6290 RepID=A0A0N4W3N3_HAEPC|nr:unnamed protein product [Haemonchus placei]